MIMGNLNLRNSRGTTRKGVEIVNFQKQKRRNLSPFLNIILSQETQSQIYLRFRLLQVGNRSLLEKRNHG